ncbi:hypothetical protein DRQ11_05810 [candidate division KSB1 bacterium]|nr:MAG: hypothetical protein DRQ11_05810 [candidate division KSB1 bacterium]
MINRGKSGSQLIFPSKQKVPLENFFTATIQLALLDSRGFFNNLKKFLDILILNFYFFKKWG